MTIFWTGTGVSTPPTVLMHLQPGLDLAIPLIGPQAEVTGFGLPVEHLPTQEDADGLAQKFQTLYDALPDSQKVLMAALVGQAANYADQTWSADAGGLGSA